MARIPIIDLAPFLTARDPTTVQEIRDACAEFGFFCIQNHGIDLDLQERLEHLSHQFFALPDETKLTLSMSRGGRAWRGFFPVGDELTSGKPDLKEGLYLGEELGPSDSRVARQWPLHGANLFPDTVIPELRPTVLEYFSEMTRLSHTLMEAISLGLGLPADFFHANYTARPTPLFRIFHYPAITSENAEKFPWGVGEHTDYGLLTILKQDQIGGLEVQVNDTWISIPPVPNTFVCNVGDMLDFLSRGRYLSAPHRVKNTSGKSRYSYPFFFDPDFAARITPLPLGTPSESNAPRTRERWDQQDLHAFQGTYGEYLLGKVAKVFPDLAGMKFS